MSKKTVVFFYPSKVTGGAEFLFKTAAEMLAGEFSVGIVDIPGGWLSENTSIENKIILEQDKIQLDPETVLITTSNHVRYLDGWFSGDFKVLAWTIQPYNVIPALPKLGGIQYKNKAIRCLLKHTLLKGEYTSYRNLVRYLLQHNAFFVMDGECSRMIKSYLSEDCANYFPVVIPDEKFHSLGQGKQTSQATNPINAVWLGRLDGQFKNSILKRLLEDLDDYSRRSGSQIVIDIIGDGPGYLDILNKSRELKSIEAVFQGEKRGADLINILQKAIVGFAMGTSAIEIAACATPTVLLDFSYSKVHRDYRYRWFFESSDYILGRSIDASKDKSMGNKLTVADIFFDLHSNYDLVAKLSFDHAKKHHSEAQLYGLMIIAIRNASSSFSEMLALGLMKKPFWHGIKTFLSRVCRR